MDVVIFQTADAFRYQRMLAATSRTAIEFCRRHGHGYESYVGIKRGFHGWQASFNRIFQFRELIARGFAGWAVYLDADAYIHDLDFDLAGYLADKRDRAGIMVTIPGAEDPWNINSGVILLNLADRRAHRLLDDWMARFMALSDDHLRRETAMQDYDNDQHMLFGVLHGTPALREAIHYESSDLINSMNARFIRQHLRAYMPSVEERTRSIELMVEELLGPAHGEEPIGRVAPAVVAALYRVLLDRDPDPQGLGDFTGRIRAIGLERGLGDILAAMLGSAEYRGRRSG